METSIRNTVASNYNSISNFIQPTTSVVSLKKKGLLSSGILRKVANSFTTSFFPISSKYITDKPVLLYTSYFSSENHSVQSVLQATMSSNMQITRSGEYLTSSISHIQTYDSVDRKLTSIDSLPIPVMDVFLSSATILATPVKRLLSTSIIYEQSTISKHTTGQKLSGSFTKTLRMDQKYSVASPSSNFSEVSCSKSSTDSLDLISSTTPTTQIHFPITFQERVVSTAFGSSATSRPVFLAKYSSFLENYFGAMKSSKSESAFSSSMKTPVHSLENLSSALQNTAYPVTYQHKSISANLEKSFVILSTVSFHTSHSSVLENNNTLIPQQSQATRTTLEPSSQLVSPPRMLQNLIKSESTLHSDLPTVSQLNTRHPNSYSSSDIKGAPMISLSSTVMETKAVLIPLGTLSETLKTARLQSIPSVKFISANVHHTASIYGEESMFINSVQSLDMEGSSEHFFTSNSYVTRAFQVLSSGPSEALSLSSSVPCGHEIISSAFTTKLLSRSSHNSAFSERNGSKFMVLKEPNLTIHTQYNMISSSEPIQVNLSRTNIVGVVSYTVEAGGSANVQANQATSLFGKFTSRIDLFTATSQTVKSGTESMPMSSRNFGKDASVLSSLPSSSQLGFYYSKEIYATPTRISVQPTIRKLQSAPSHNFLKASEESVAFKETSTSHLLKTGYTSNRIAFTSDSAFRSQSSAKLKVDQSGSHFPFISSSEESYLSKPTEVEKEQNKRKTEVHTSSAASMDLKHQIQTSYRSKSYDMIDTASSFDTHPLSSIESSSGTGFAEMLISPSPSLSTLSNRRSGIINKRQSSRCKDCEYMFDLFL